MSSDEIKIIQKLEDDLNNYDQKIQISKKFGIYLNPDKNIIKRRAYSKLSQLANIKKLSHESLEWMGDFAEKGPYEDIKQYYKNHKWVDQYREMKQEVQHASR